MLSAADIAAEQDGALRDLFEAGAELALQLQADAMAAASPDERTRLAVGFHRVARGARQTAALRIRLARAAEEAGQAADERAAGQAKARLEARKRQLTARVERLIWTEAEDEEADTELRLRLEDLVRIEADDPEAFLAEPLADQVARLCADLGLEPPSAPPCEGGDPGRASARSASESAWGDHEDPFRSSA